MVKWIQKDGTKIEISEMDDNHLNNTIKFIENRKLRISWNLRMRELSNFSVFSDSNCNDSVQDAIDSGISELANLSDLEVLFKYHESYRAMLNEAQKRGLLTDIGVKLIKIKDEMTCECGGILNIEETHSYYGMIDFPYVCQSCGKEQ